MSIEPIWLQASAAFIGALAAFTAAIYGVITRPLLKRMDDIRADLIAMRTEMNAGFEKVNRTLSEHGERIARLEARIPPLVRN